MFTNDADAMVVLLTPHALQAPNIRYEIGYAPGNKNYKDRVVPVLAASPEQMPRDQIPWVLHKFRTVNLLETGREEGFKQIAQVLHDAA